MIMEGSKNMESIAGKTLLWWYSGPQSD